MEDIWTLLTEIIDYSSAQSSSFDKMRETEKVSRSSCHCQAPDAELVNSPTQYLAPLNNEEY
jgi:hypothetical protein